MSQSFCPYVAVLFLHLKKNKDKVWVTILIQWLDKLAPADLKLRQIEQPQDLFFTKEEIMFIVLLAVLMKNVV